MFPRPATAATAENIGTVTEVYDGTLTSDIQVNTFRHIERLFPVSVVKHGPQVLALPRAGKPLPRVEFTSGGKSYDLIDYMALNRVTALLVLKYGKIAYEDYEMGNTERTRWMSMSMVKTITSSLVGAAIQDGFIRSIDDPVTQYVAKLKGSVYDGVSVRYLLQTASGVKWDETYTNPASDRRRMLEAQIAQRPGAILDLMARLPRAGAPERSGTTARARHSWPVRWCVPRWAVHWRSTVGTNLDQGRHGSRCDVVAGIARRPRDRRQRAQRNFARLWPVRVVSHERRSREGREDSAGRVGEGCRQPQDDRRKSRGLRLHDLAVRRGSGRHE
jgi:hypothetical protein